MKRFLIHAAVGATVLAVAFGLSAFRADARDYWNGSGFSLDHNFHSPFDNLFGQYSYRGRYYAPPRRTGNATRLDDALGALEGQTFEVVPLASEATLREQERRAVAKAIAGEHACAAVKLYTDDGVVHHSALGCK